MGCLPGSFNTPVAAFVAGFDELLPKPNRPPPDDFAGAGTGFAELLPKPNRPPPEGFDCEAAEAFDASFFTGAGGFSAFAAACFAAGFAAAASRCVPPRIAVPALRAAWFGAPGAAILCVPNAGFCRTTRMSALCLSLLWCALHPETPENEALSAFGFTLLLRLRDEL